MNLYPLIAAETGVWMVPCTFPSFYLIWSRAILSFLSSFEISSLIHGLLCGEMVFQEATLSADPLRLSSIDGR